MRTGENIYKRKDGRWEARYRKGRDEFGKIQYGFCYGKTYSAAKEKAAKARMEKQVNARTDHRKEQQTLSFYCDEWLSLNCPRLRESTYVKYQTALGKYIKPLLCELAPELFNSQIVGHFSRILQQEHHLAAKSMKDILLILHSIFQYIQRQYPGIMPEVKIVYPKDEPREIRVLSCAEQKCLTNFLLTDLDLCKLGVLMSLWTGIRIGELCALRRDHVLLDAQEIRIDATMQRLKATESEAHTRTAIVIGPPKSASSIRAIPIPKQALNLCKQLLPEDPDTYFLTGTRRYMEPRTLQCRFRRYTEACSLATVHFHTLRHTFATRCIEAGFEIKALSEVMGHANASITINRYVHCSMDLKWKNMEKVCWLE